MADDKKPKPCDDPQPLGGGTGDPPKPPKPPKPDE